MHLLRRGLVSAAARRACTTSAANLRPRAPSPPPEVQALSLEELRATTAGGASAFDRGKRGVDVDGMLEFWRGHGLDDESARALAARAESDGGVWGDPPTLVARLAAAERTLPLLPLSTLLRKYPDVVQSRPETIRQKLETLSAVLPAVDVIHMVARHPSLLRRSPGLLKERALGFLVALPRADMAQLAAVAPQLLDLAPSELAARAAAIRHSYVITTIMRWPRSRALKLLRTPSVKLQRLQHVDTLNPHLRTAVPDRKFLEMDEPLFHRRFVAKRRSLWRRRPGVQADRDAAAAPRRSRGGLFEAAHVPPRGVRLLEWGRAEHKRRSESLRLVR